LLVHFWSDGKIADGRTGVSETLKRQPYDRHWTCQAPTAGRWMMPFY
jgi:hypothetical protein